MTATTEQSQQTKPEFSNKKALKGLGLGLLALRATKGKTGRLTEKASRRVLAKDSTVLGRSISRETTAKVETLSRETEFWHGTGRYQYRDGKVIDVLQGIINQGGLIPQHDDIDLIGAMDSVSLARSRTYARAYADMHEHGSRSARHGSAMLWAAAFIGPLAFKIGQEEKLWKSANRQRVREHFKNSNAINWPSKVRKEPTGTLGIFALGSDIEGNYPILFGVKEGVVRPTETSKSVAIHEVRSTEPIGFSDLTHIEVPENKIAETSAMLADAGLAIPLFAIEDFEALMATKPFQELVSPGSATSK